MPDDPKLPDNAPGLPTMDTTPAEKTVGDVLFDLFRRHTLNFIIGALVFCGATFGALADEAARMGWSKTAFVGKVIQPGCVALLAFLAKFQETK